MAGITLYYFPARGRVEPFRMCMAAAGKPIDSIDITFEEWPAKKASSPYGQLPYIVYKGKTYGESKAIASFIARECGLAGTSSEEAMRVDEVYCLVGGLMENMGKVVFEKDPETKTQLRKHLREETIPTYLGFFENMLKDTGSGYLAGKALTLADLTVYDITFTMLRTNANVLDKFPEIQRMRKNVEANKNVKNYLDTRPDLDM